MLELKTLLRYQLIYYALGMLFNYASINEISKGMEQLTPNDPYQGSIVMTIYACFLIPGFLGRIKLYRILMAVSVVILGYGGIFVHIGNYLNRPEMYASLAAAIIGPGINVFGLVLNLFGALGKFKSSQLR